MNPLSEFLALRPAGGYGAILVDPLWSYEMYSDKGHGKSPHAHYDCMDQHKMALIPVSAMASENCLMWMWATWPMLPQAMDLMAAWGFTYKTGGAWHKKTVHGKDAFGTGYIFRSASEPFLVGTIGSPKTTRSVRNIIEAPVREHSRKPDAAYDKIERLIPGARKLEMFARQTRPGWDAWGIGIVERQVKGADFAIEEKCEAVAFFSVHRLSRFVELGLHVRRHWRQIVPKGVRKFVGPNGRNRKEKSKE